MALLNVSSWNGECVRFFLFKNATYLWPKPKRPPIHLDLEATFSCVFVQEKAEELTASFHFK